MLDSDKPPFAKFFAEIHDGCIPRIDRATITTVGIQDDEIKHDRTGVLYRITDDHFILTAAHKLRGIVDLEIPLYISVKDQPVNNSVISSWIVLGCS